MRETVAEQISAFDRIFRGSEAGNSTVGAKMFSAVDRSSTAPRYGNTYHFSTHPTISVYLGFGVGKFGETFRFGGG